MHNKPYTTVTLVQLGRAIRDLLHAGVDPDSPMIIFDADSGGYCVATQHLGALVVADIEFDPTTNEPTYLKEGRVSRRCVMLLGAEALREGLHKRVYRTKIEFFSEGNDERGNSSDHTEKSTENARDEQPEFGVSSARSGEQI